ncbi:serine/threonine-protein kinase [Streptomyces justiciae]|uniref:non-specific serine/threonine protein kinase n=1 Tax=Streptomyces justiciae TaxID=2780140 RepID=A0ABU3LSQ4_9ACTN|nr:serine/threonine-protein kinase [Streptomyces justiciae]MDT7842108.1 serine/threonine-protein kinase [Streptomyces justiciae]
MSEADRRGERRVVDGRFELEARLGGGGMGTVWRARDLVLHRLVAVKEVRPPDRDLAEYDPEGARMLRERVLREARALARIDHPNVVTIHHIVDGGEGTYPWLVMELVSGGSLADRLAQGPMPPAEAARIGRGVLAALTAAHDAGIQHRDVKPANVLLRPDGRPVLTDFGIAAIRESTTLTATGSIIGTADFMAPERITGQEGGAASDLWSLAMMLYTAVEARHPLRRGTTLATLAAVLHEDVPPPARAGALGEILMSVLVRDPAARPSAAELDRGLAEIESRPAGPAVVREEPTSYPLTPPHAPPPTTTGFGPPPVLPGPPVQISPQAPTAPVTTTRRRGTGSTVLRAVSGVTLVGAVGLAWWLLPLDDNTGDGNLGASPSTSTSMSSSPKPTGSRTTSAPSSEESEGSDDSGEADVASGSMLTPANIRTAIKALKEKTGRDRFGDFTVYDDYVSAQVMVKGSDTKYDSYSYYPDRGVVEGIIKSTLMSGRQPFTLDGYAWDKVPALLKEADEKLNVPDPELRYVIAESANTVFDEPASMSVYLSDDYGSGYLQATPQGKVTDVYPADK